MEYVKPVIPGHTGVVPVIDPGVDGAAGNTTNVISLLVAVVGEAQVAFEVRTMLILSVFTKVLVENKLLFVPTLVVPFNFH